MRLRVLFLARLREIAGVRDVVVDVADGTITSLKHSLGTQFPAEVMAALFADNTRLACNHAIWDGARAFADGDEVAFLPPVTGG